MGNEDGTTHDLPRFALREMGAILGAEIDRRLDPVEDRLTRIEQQLAYLGLSDDRRSDARPWQWQDDDLYHQQALQIKDLTEEVARLHAALGEAATVVMDHLTSSNEPPTEAPLLKRVHRLP